MKLKYIIPSILAVITMFMGCSEEFKASYLGSIRVSSSYLAIPGGGGSAEMTVSANGDWTLSDVPEWLTVAPMSGSAGETTVTVSAPATKGALNATIKITCGTSVQEINVTQGKVVVEPATCKQIIDGEDGKTYRVTGKVTSIGNTTYGNWYLQDETGEVYIYGTLDKNGATKNFSSLGIEIGDQVTVEGPKKTYNGTVELVDVTVLNIEKSLLKVVAPEEIPVISKTGGELELKVAFKGKGVMPEVKSEYSWIHYRSMKVEAGTVSAVNPNPADTAYVKFTFDANEGKSRKGEIVLSSTNGTESSSITIAITQEAGASSGGEGGKTGADGSTIVSIADFNAAPVSNDVYYQLTGTVTNLKEGDQYGNFDLVDESGSVYVYGLLSEKGGEKKKFQELVAAKGIKEGSKITIVGTRGEYNGKIEVMNAYFISIDEGGEGGGGSTTGADGSTIITVADFNAAPESTDVWYQLTGTISNLKENDLYGNFDLTDETGSVYVYGVLSEKGGEKKKFQELVAAKGIANGKTITIVGNRGSYTNKNTGETKIEVMNAYFISVK